MSRPVYFYFYKVRGRILTIPTTVVYYKNTLILYVLWEPGGGTGAEKTYLKVWDVFMPLTLGEPIFNNFQPGKRIFVTQKLLSEF